mgnify:CR=1 FL=1
MLPIAPIKKPIGLIKIAMKKNTTERISIPKASSKLCKIILIKDITEETPVKSKNNFNFPPILDFKVKKISIAPNKKKRIVRGKKRIPRTPLSNPNANNNIGIRKFVIRIRIKSTINA